MVIDRSVFVAASFALIAPRRAIAGPDGVDGAFRSLARVWRGGMEPRRWWPCRRSPPKRLRPWGAGRGVGPVAPAGPRHVVRQGGRRARRRGAGARCVRHGRQPAGGADLQAPPARVGGDRGIPPGGVRGPLARAVLPGPRRGGRHQRRRRRPSCNQLSPTSPTSTCAWSATTSPPPTSRPTAVPRPAFPSRTFGYSRDHRSDRPQVVIGLLCTGDGIPIAHHVFAGDTADASTWPKVLKSCSSASGWDPSAWWPTGADLRSQRGGRGQRRLGPRAGHPSAP